MADNLAFLLYTLYGLPASGWAASESYGSLLSLAQLYPALMRPTAPSPPNDHTDPMSQFWHNVALSELGALTPDGPYGARGPEQSSLTDALSPWAYTDNEGVMRDPIRPHRLAPPGVDIPRVEKPSVPSVPMPRLPREGEFFHP